MSVTPEERAWALFTLLQLSLPLQTPEESARSSLGEPRVCPHCGRKTVCRHTSICHGCLQHCVWDPDDFRRLIDRHSKET